MRSSSIPVGDPITFGPHAPETDEAAINDAFRWNYLQELSLRIERQQSRIDRFEFLTEKAYDLVEGMALFRSDAEGDGITRDERLELHDMREALAPVRDRIQEMPDYDSLTDRLMRLEMEFLHKSDEWDLRL